MLSMSLSTLIYIQLTQTILHFFLREKSSVKKLINIVATFQSIQI